MVGWSSVEEAKAIEDFGWFIVAKTRDANVSGRCARVEDLVDDSFEKEFECSEYVAEVVVRAVVSAPFVGCCLLGCFRDEER